MVDINNMFALQMQIFIFMLLGFLLYKANIIDANKRKILTNLVMYFILPCNIIYSFLIELNEEILTSCFLILMVSLVIQIACELASRFLYPFASKEQYKVLKYATICSNAGFMGSPLVNGIYGLQGLLYASIYLIPQRIIMWSSGISCFSEASKKDVIKKVITHPCIIAVIIGLLIMLTQVTLPSSIENTLGSVSNTTTIFSMIVIGGILAEIDFRTIFSKLSWYYTVLRLLCIPLLVFIVCYILKLPMLVTAVSAVLAGMPAGTTTAILAENYDGDSSLAVKLIFLSTALSLLTIPSLCLFMEQFIA